MLFPTLVGAGGDRSLQPISLLSYVIVAARVHIVTGDELKLDGCAPESVQEISFADHRLGHASGVHHAQPV
jgi:hypothetical protein